MMILMYRNILGVIRNKYMQTNTLCICWLNILEIVRNVSCKLYQDCTQFYWIPPCPKYVVRCRKIWRFYTVVTINPVVVWLRKQFSKKNNKYRLLYTYGCTSDNGPIYARNMWRLTKYAKNRLCIKLVFLYTIISRCAFNKTLKKIRKQCRQMAGYQTFQRNILLQRGVRVRGKIGSFFSWKFGKHPPDSEYWSI